MKPYRPDQKKWNNFSQEMQLKNIAAELSRATGASLRGNAEFLDGAYERAISLIDASIADPKWEDKAMLYQLRDAVAALYAGNRNAEISRYICSQLLAYNK